MAFDEGLARRVREALGSRADVSERRMFGGLAFLVDGKMFVGISGAKLMARVGTERYEDALSLPHVREMNFTGKPMKGYVYVDPPGLAEDRDLDAWVSWCANHVASLPAKARAKRARASKPALLAGGNPQIAKSDGDAAVQAYIAAMPGWKSDVGRRLDALIVRTVPGVRKAIRWNSPFYGIEGRGWFVGFHTFTHFVKVTFFLGTSLRPAPSGGKAKEARWIDVHEDDLDEAQMVSWIRQAAALPGWGKS